MLYLRIERGEGRQAVLPLAAGVVRFGRLSDNTVVIDDYAVSRYHAELDASGGRARVRDLGSRNGTLVTGRGAASLAGADGDGTVLLRHDPDDPESPREAILEVGDELRIGRVRVVLGEALSDGDGAIADEDRRARAALTSAPEPATLALSDGETLDVSGVRAAALLDFVARFALDLSAPDEAGAVPALERLRRFFAADRVDLLRADGDALALLWTAPADADAALPPSDSAELIRLAQCDRPSRVVWSDDGRVPSLAAALGDRAVLLVRFAADSLRPSTEELRSLEVIAAIAGQFLRLASARTALAEHNRQLQADAEVWRRTADRSRTEPDVVAASPAMRQVLDEAARAARSARPVLLEGETGVGKEVIARFVHHASPRHGRRFVAVNSAALGAELFVSEMFGHRRGAFTSAVADKVGLYELADGGTLFLDEVGELEASAQARLLRVLEDGSYRRLGEERERTADVRIIAATHRDLGVMVEAGSFREDLYFRLSVLPLRIPPLRDRAEDVLPLARRFLDHAARDAQLGSTPSLDVEASRLLHAWHWPGNVRELRNVVERAAALSDGPVITAEHLSFAPRDPDGRTLAALLGMPRDDAMEGFKKLYVERLLLACEGNVSRAARTAGMARRNLHQLIVKYGLKRPGDANPA